MSEIENIEFISSDPKEILESILKIYKDETGITLPLSDPRKIDYNVIAYYISQVRAHMNEAIKQNFIRFASGVRLDLKGELYGKRGERIPEGTARTTIECRIQAAQNRDVIIPKGTRFLKDSYIFLSISEGIIKQGELKTEIVVECSTRGFVPKFKAGEIKEIVDLYDFYESCENVTDVLGGVDKEEDNDYRKRLMEVPESFSVAGPGNAYKFYVKSVSNLIKDVIVKSPNPCYIDIYICGENGRAIPEELKKEIMLEIESKRPQGDRVEIKDPERVQFNIELSYSIYKKDEGKAMEIDKNIKNDIQDYVNIICSKMGEDINPQDIICICKNAGAKRINLTSPLDISISDIQIGECRGINITTRGVEE